MKRILLALALMFAVTACDGWVSVPPCDPGAAWCHVQ